MTQDYIYKCLLTGKSTKDISEDLQLPEKSIKWYLTELYKERGVKSKYELIAKHVVIPEELQDVPHPNSSETRVNLRIKYLKEKAARIKKEAKKKGLPVGSMPVGVN
jgi:DNA-binding CsgD family transcriptional regulator